MKDRILPPINMILLRHGNHSTLSGYDRISDYIPTRTFHRPRRLRIWQRVLTRVFGRSLRRSGSKWYGGEDFISELLVGFQWLKRSGQVFHFVYGENSYRYIGNLKRLRRNFIVCTYHTPPKRFAEVVKDREHLKVLDAVIVVSSVSFDLFADLLGPERVHLIPHGVDTDFFAPPQLPREDGKPFRCLFVGSHLRDFESLALVATQFEKAGRNFVFEIITLQRDFHYFEGLSNVVLRHRISDEELRAAYQQADLFVMPLKDSTANNSLLEAMACGLPIVTSELSGVRDYANDTSARFVPVGDSTELANCILELSCDKAARLKMARNARSQASEFSFQKVSQMTEDLYLHLVQRDQARRGV